MMAVLSKAENSFSDLQEAKRVLDLESRALSRLGEHLGPSFTRAVDILQKTDGRVVVTGMGKSGHIARKIASTLSSTGTVAFFIHPAEASHGDLGMLNGGDSLIVLSNSGETSELSDIISFAHRRHIPIIGMTFGETSTLAKVSDAPLILPKTEEACPLGLAPTTSTTMMLALGDAIATTLLKRKGFSPEDFGSLHPGGKLGQRLLRVGQIMHDPSTLPLVSLETSMQEALLVMSAKGFGCVGVIDKHQELAGIITDGDLRRHMTGGLLEKTAEDVMTKDPCTIPVTALAEDALAVMNEKGITSLFTVDSDLKTLKPVGIVHIHDCLRAGIS